MFANAEMFRSYGADKKSCSTSSYKHFVPTGRYPARGDRTLSNAASGACLFGRKRLVIFTIHRKCVMAVATEEKVLATNRAAFHNYHISQKYEAGAALTGTEVKSVLDGRIQLKESYVGVRDGEAWLFNAHISPYSHGNLNNHDPLRTRKLLLHRREIDKLDKSAATDGMTLVVTRVYIKSRKIKFEVGVAKGKKLYDKRETEMRKIVDRETRAQLKQRNR